MECKIFNIGDLVYTNKKYNSLEKGKEYKVLEYFKPPGYIDSYGGILIRIKNDLGNIGVYSSNNFEKSKNQLRKEKIKNLIYEN